METFFKIEKKRKHQTDWRCWFRNEGTMLSITDKWISKSTDANSRM